jgi:transcriptional regulator with XRE-family HTH domain
MTDDKQKATFQASPEQLKFAESYLDFAEKKTFEEIAKDINVSRTTIWRWFQDEAFVTWLNSKKDEVLSKSLMARYMTAIRKAEGGDFNFSRLLFEIQNEYIPTIKQDINIKVTEIIISHVVEVINKFITDEDIRKQISEELYKIHLD